ncbi:MAG: accessory gene regulator B family protein [Eubacterium sp.]|nr:accessory gene regulator B family protein [Eubacterium sp.]
MDKVINKLMDFLYKNQENMSEERYEIVKYGLEILLIKYLFFSAALIIGILMHSFLECLIFIIFLSTIRSKTGGYHADTRIQCFVQSMLTFVFALSLLKLETLYKVILIPLSILALCSAIIIWLFAPIDTKNKPLSENEKKIFGTKSKVMLCLETVIAIVAYFIGFDGISCSIMLVFITTSLLVLMGMKKNSK